MRAAAVALLAGGGASYRTPDFSWDTLPVAWHSALAAENISAADVRTLARYPLVTLEKTAGAAAFEWDPRELKWRVPITCQNGTDVSACGCCEEDRMVRHAAQIKAANPRVHIVAYMNSILSYPWYRSGSVFAAHPEWWMHDRDGGLPSGTPGATWHTWDFTQPAVGDLWREMCLNVTRSGVIDGCFMDGCSMAPGPLAPAVRTAYMRNKVAWQQRLQGEVPGLLVCGSGGTTVDGVAATQIQNWGGGGGNFTGYSYQIPLLQRAVAAGKVFEAHAACGTGDPADPEEQTRIAAFLVAAGEGSYYLCGAWQSNPPLRWPKVFDMPLGAPLGNATLSGGVYTRHFARGTVARFDTVTNRGTIAWGS